MMKRTLIILAVAVILSGNRELVDMPGYIGPPVVVRLCQIFPQLCAR